MSDLEHGAVKTYGGTSRCRCEYCTAAARVYGRKGDQTHLLALIREAAVAGDPIPAEAVTQPRTSRKAHNAAESAVAGGVAARSHQARLRAVEHAGGSVAALAMLSVAEYTDDPIRAARYERVGRLLAEEVS